MGEAQPLDPKSLARQEPAADYHIDEVIKRVMGTPQVIQVKNALQIIVMTDHGTVLGKDMGHPDQRREVGMGWVAGVPGEPSNAHRYHGHIEEIVRAAIQVYAALYQPEQPQPAYPNQG